MTDEEKIERQTIIKAYLTENRRADGPTNVLVWNDVFKGFRNTEIEWAMNFARRNASRMATADEIAIYMRDHRIVSFKKEVNKRKKQTLKKDANGRPIPITAALRATLRAAYFEGVNEERAKGRAWRREQNLPQISAYDPYIDPTPHDPEYDPDMGGVGAFGGGK